MSHADPAEIRASLDHPVIDADGHLVEYWPEFDRHLKAEGVEGGMARFMSTANFDGSRLWAQLSPEERLRERAFRGPWWGFPNDARDLATAMAPRLLHSRLDELGIDFAVCYPSVGLQMPAQRDERLRRLGCRAYNRYAAEQFEGLGDRLLPVGVVPTVDPDEAIEELEFAVQELGLKAVLIGGFVPRGFEGGDERAFWIDGLGLDSPYDYDPLWRRLVELEVVPSVHSGAMGWSGRRSISNFSYNHMGHFAGANEVTAKSLFFGGVFHRFPELRVAFLEGGAGWAVQMFVSLVEHFEKRGPAGLRKRDPAGIDAELFDRLLEEHAGSMPVVEGWGKTLQQVLATPDVVNDFEAAGVESTDDIVRQITSQCFVGCEADDRLAGVAFDANRLPGGVPLNPMFSSDIGHWDVAHMREVLPEAHEHLEHGWMDRGQLRAFLCDNVLRMFTDMNPKLFKGTVIEGYADAQLGEA
jgi:predicted TIM-barrel fold metal-dependent hydrolase